MKHVVILVALLLVVLLIPVQISAQPKGQEAVFLESLNAERQALGLAHYTVNPILELMAADHVKNMQRYHYCSHVYFDPVTQTFVPITYLQKYGWTAPFGECALMGTTSGDKAVRMFKTSAGHWSALMDSYFNVIGIAKASDYWCVEIGQE